MITNSATSARPLGVVLFQGGSELDGQPVVAIATGFARPTSNEKTGNLVATWILRADVDPVTATHAAADVSVCGRCPLRGIVERDATGRTTNRLRACYVRVGQAPRAVFDAWQRGRYEPFDQRKHLDLFQGRMLRLGSYGDPVAIPFRVWSPLLAVVDGHCGYTHQWRNGRFWRFRECCMASVESLADARLAQEAGWRTFRTTAPGEQPVRREIRCPASAEAGKRLTCEACGACNGANGRPQRASVVIAAHGAPPTLRSYARLIDSD